MEDAAWLEEEAAVKLVTEAVLELPDFEEDERSCLDELDGIALTAGEAGVSALTSILLGALEEDFEDFEDFFASFLRSDLLDFFDDMV